jgi:mRNA-degrading endonuclease YafQ of YafQ-DinJ toxin-antitoxin module
MNRSNFVLYHTSEYERDFKKIARKDKLLASKVLDVSERLEEDDIVLLHRIGGHSGGFNVYK